MKNSSIQSIDRIFDIIEVISEYPKGLTITEISKKVQLTKSTVHRQLNSLVLRGYATKDPQTNKYRLTLRFYEIGIKIMGGFDIVELTRPYLEKLVKLVGETVHLVVLDGAEVIYLYKEESTKNTIRTASRVGLRSPLYCTSVGKSILAFMSDDEVRALWDNMDITKRTNKTITSLDALLDDLKKIRKRSYALDDEENELGVRCVGAAIVDYSGRAVGAISVSAPINRMDKEVILRISQHVIETSKLISTFLGNI